MNQRRIIPAIVLVVGLLLSTWLYLSLDHKRQVFDRTHFETMTNQMQNAIVERIGKYEDALRGGVAFFTSSQNVTRDEWKTYIQTTDLIERYPGISAVGVSFLVPQNNSAENSVVYVNAYQEPTIDHCMSVGMDFSKDEKLKKTADLARDTGLLQMADYLDFKKNVGCDFLVFAPLYKNSMPTDTVEQRRIAIQGWIYAQFGTRELFDKLQVGAGHELDLFLFYGDSLFQDQLWYRSDWKKELPDQFEKNVSFKMFGKTFTLAWQRTSRFSVMSNAPTLWAALSSVFLSLLLSGLIANLFSLEYRAKKIAEESNLKLKATQEQLAESQKMQAIGQLAGGIAHDFNNILGGILGYASLLEDKFSPDTKEAQQMQIIISSAERAAKLTRDLLGFARKGQYESIKINLNETIEEALQILSTTFDDKISILKNYSHELWFVEGDSTQLLQIILNLSVNARDAVSDSGEITIMTENVTLMRAEAADYGLSFGRYVHLVFGDNGQGILPEIANRIFEPFFTTKEPGKGTGLGLSMIYGIMQNYRGTIFLDKSTKKGAVFHLYFPAV